MLFLSWGLLKLVLTVALLHSRDGDVTPVRDDQQAKVSATEELRVTMVSLFWTRNSQDILMIVVEGEASSVISTVSTRYRESDSDSDSDAIALDRKPRRFGH